MVSEISDSEILSRDDIIKMKELFKQITSEYFEKYLQNTHKGPHKKALTSYYNITFSERVDSKRRRKPRPALERIYESIDLDRLNRLSILEAKVKKLANQNAKAKKNYRKRTAEIIKLEREKIDKNPSTTDDNDSDDYGTKFASELKALDWAIESAQKFELSLEQLNELSAQSSKTEEKVRTLASISKSEFIAKSKQSTPIKPQNQVPQRVINPNWGFNF